MEVQVELVELKESCGTTLPESENSRNEENSLVEDLLNSVHVNGEAQEDDDIVDMFLLAEKSEFTVVDEAIGSPQQSNGFSKVEANVEGSVDTKEESTTEEVDEKLHSTETIQPETEYNLSEEEESKLLMSPTNNALREKDNTKAGEVERKNNDVNEAEPSSMAEGAKESIDEADSSANISDIQVAETPQSQIAQSEDNESWHSAENQQSVPTLQCETTIVDTNNGKKDFDQEAVNSERPASIQELEIQKESEEPPILEKVAEKAPKSNKRKRSSGRNQGPTKEQPAPIHVLRKRKIKTEIEEDKVNEVYIKEEKCTEELLPEEVGTAAMFIKSEGSQSRTKSPKPLPEKRNLRPRTSLNESPKKSPHIKGNVINCKICGRFSRPETIDAHMLTHDNPVPKPPVDNEISLTCRLCTKEFGTSKSVRNHMRQKHNCTEIIRCIKCDFMTSNSIHFRKHIKSHDPKLLSCDTCDFKSPVKRVLRHHIEVTHGKLHKCNHCAKAFAILDELGEHKTHFHVKTKYRCRHCKRYFNKGDNLTRHEKTCK